MGEPFLIGILTAGIAGADARSIRVERLIQSVEDRRLWGLANDAPVQCYADQ